MHSRALLAVTALLFAFLAPHAHAEGDELQNISQLISRKQHTEAAANLDRYLAAHPQDAQGLFLKGLLLSEQKKTDDAIRIFNDLIAQHPSWPEPYNNLAVLYASQGQYERARQTLEMALRTHPTYAAVHDNLSGIYAAMASEAYGKALQTGDNAARPQPRLAMVGLPYGEKRTLTAASSPRQPAPVPIHTAMTVAAKPAAPAAAPSAPAAAAPVAAASVATTIAAAQPAAKPEPPQPKPTAAPADDQAARVEDTVKGWAKAWSRQDVDKYLDYYADSFKTPKGESRRAWEQTRRARIKSPKSIAVDVSGIRSQIDNNRAEVRFKQNYRADKLAKRTSKTLILQKSGERWLIVQELTTR